MGLDGNKSSTCKGSKKIKQRKLVASSIALLVGLNKSIASILSIPNRYVNNNMLNNDNREVFLLNRNIPDKKYKHAAITVTVKEFI